MPSIGRQFGKGEGVPRKDLALAALGVEKAKKGLERERKGAKGLDEIRLSAAEMENAKEAEGVEGWDRERMYQWAKTIGNDEKYNKAWVDETFKIFSDGRIECLLNSLNLHDTQISEIPPNLHVQEVLYISLCPSVRMIPDSLQVKELYLQNTQVQILPPGLQVQKIYLQHTNIREIPENKGAIEEIVISKKQTDLKASAKALGITVRVLSW